MYKESNDAYEGMRERNDFYICICVYLNTMYIYICLIIYHICGNDVYLYIWIEKWYVPKDEREEWGLLIYVYTWLIYIYVYMFPYISYMYESYMYEWHLLVYM